MHKMKRSNELILKTKKYIRLVEQTLNFYINPNLGGWGGLILAPPVGFPLITQKR